MRSSREITEFIAEFQSYLRENGNELRGDDADSSSPYPTTYPLIPALSLETSLPEIIDTSSTPGFGGIILRTPTILKKIKTQAEPVFMCLMGAHQSRHLKRMMEKENITIQKLDPLAVSGCQFPCVVLVLEPNSYPEMTWKEVILAMSRATTSLFVIACKNLKKEPNAEEFVISKFFLEDSKKSKRIKEVKKLDPQAQ